MSSSSRPESPSALIAARPMSAYQRFALGICLLIGLLDGYDALTIGYVVPSIARDWGMVPGDLTPVVTAGLVGLIVGAITLGALGDRRGRRFVVISGMGLFAVFSGALAFAPNLFTLGLFRFLAGVGLGAVLPSIIALAVEFSSARRKVIAAVLVATSVHMGGFLGGILSTWLIPTFGWQSVFLVGGILPLLVLPFVVRLLPESLAFLSANGRESEVRNVLRKIDPALGDTPLGPEAGAQAQDTAKAPIRVLFVDGRGPSTLLLWLGYFCGYVMIFVVTSWMPTLLNGAGLSPSVAIWATALSTLATMIGAILLGWLTDRRGQDYSLIGISFVIGIPVVIGLVYSLSSAPMAILFAILLGFFLLAPVSGLAALAANMYPASARTTGVGWALTAARAGSVVGPLVVGILIQQGYAPATVFALAIVPAVISAVSILFLARRARADLRQLAGLESAERTPTATPTT